MRKLASIKTINELRPIPKADRLELARIGGWYAVVQKGEFKVGDHAVYIEIDSFVDTSKPQFAFLEKDAIDWRGRRGTVIRTMKLRGQISQGLAIPVIKFPQVVSLYSNLDLVMSKVEDWDLTELLGIVKYEEDLHESLADKAIGKTPAWLRGSSLERVQELDSIIGDYLDEEFAVSVKIDGEAMSVYHLPGTSPYSQTKEDYVGVCTDTVNWKEDDTNKSWVLAKALGLHREVKRFAEHPELAGGVQLQGERCGPGVQKNRFKFAVPMFLVYGITDIGGQVRLSASDIRLYSAMHGLLTVPYLHYKTTLREIIQCYKGPTVIDALVEYASGRHSLPVQPGVDLDTAKLLNWKYDGQEHEGLVFHHNASDFRFKVISPKYLLKHGV